MSIKSINNYEYIFTPASNLKEIQAIQDFVP